MYKLCTPTIEKISCAKKQHGRKGKRYRGIIKVSMDTTLICGIMNLNKWQCGY
ncbi:hypothetical protein [Staphylococcus arlettae]|uniref:hypothetical protein n=1 Tax=Staphylococcus arlettae TaxID=29378 RepID=UPI00398A5FE6